MINEDKIINKLIEQGEVLAKLESLVGEFSEFQEKQTTANEEMLSILRRMDEERHFTAVWIQRVEEDLKTTKEIVAKHEKELIEFKQRLLIS